MKFADLRLAEPIVRAVTAEGYVTATPIQEQSIPHVLAGRDVLGSAQTGTGKTAAFALPILDRLSKHATTATTAPHAPSRESHSHETHSRNGHATHASTSHAKRAIRCLVLCPTRELATQISEGFTAYGRNLPGVRNAVIFGGVSQHGQVETLRRGVDILIATPGRLLDLINQRFVDLKSVEVLVLDEADRMLDMGFIHDIRRIITHIPAKRQTLLFSATMPSEIRQLANSLLTNPATITVAPVSSTLETIDQSVYFVDKKNKPQLLAHLYDALPMARTIVFTRTKHGADRVVRHLHKFGIRAEAIHGNKSQNARQRALDNFKSSKTPILVATDIASRGIDVDGITHVVNYDVTHEPETYVHRIGRTARAGASGAAVSFCDRDERSNLRAIESLIRKSIPVKDDHPKYIDQPASSAEKHEPTRHEGRGRSGGGGGGRGHHERREASPRQDGHPQARRPSHGSHPAAPSSGSGATQHQSPQRNRPAAQHPASGRPTHHPNAHRSHSSNAGGTGGRRRGAPGRGGRGGGGAGGRRRSHA